MTHAQRRHIDDLKHGRCLPPPNGLALELLEELPDSFIDKHLSAGPAAEDADGWRYRLAWMTEVSDT